MLFLCQLPFEAVSLPMAWRILLSLLTNEQVSFIHCTQEDYTEFIAYDGMRDRLMDRFATMGEAESVSFLTTLAKLAQCRDSAVVAEKDFVWTAVFELLYLCFLK
jgi:hypothetical protein